MLICVLEVKKRLNQHDGEINRDGATEHQSTTEYVSGGFDQSNASRPLTEAPLGPQVKEGGAQLCSAS